MTTTRRTKDPDPRQLSLPHRHHWTVAALATPGKGYDATCQCGAPRTFPVEPVVRSITIKSQREEQ
jgi:hypothetical protein